MVYGGYGGFSGRINLPADTIGGYGQRNDELRVKIVEIKQFIQYRILGEPRFRPFLGQYMSELEWIMRRLNEEEQSLGVDVRGLYGLRDTILGLSGGSSPPWYSAGLFAAPAITIGYGFAQNFFSRSTRIINISQSLFRRESSAASVRVRVGLRGGDDFDGGDVDRGRTYVNRYDPDVERAMRLTGEYPGGPGFQGFAGRG